MLSHRKCWHIANNIGVFGDTLVTSGVVIHTLGEPVGGCCLVVFPHFATLVLPVCQSVPVLTLQAALSQDDQDLIVHVPETTDTKRLFTATIVPYNCQKVGLCLLWYVLTRINL